MQKESQKYFVFGLGAALVTFIAANGISYFFLSDGWGILPGHDGIRRVGFPFVIWEEGGFVHRNEFYWLALSADFGVALMTAVAVGFLAGHWRQGFQKLLTVFRCFRESSLHGPRPRKD